MKKVWILLTAALVTFGITACGNSEKDGDTTKAADTTTVNSEQTTTDQDTIKDTTIGDVQETTEAETLKDITGVYSPAAGNSQIEISKSTDAKSFTIKGDGISGDKYGEFSGDLTTDSDGVYQYIDGDNKIILTVDGDKINVEQFGSIGDSGFSFTGVYTKIRD